MYVLALCTPPPPPLSPPRPRPRPWSARCSYARACCIPICTICFLGGILSSSPSRPSLFLLLLLPLRLLLMLLPLLLLMLLLLLLLLLLLMLLLPPPVYWSRGRDGSLGLRSEAEQGRTRLVGLRSGKQRLLLSRRHARIWYDRSAGSWQARERRRRKGRGGE